jgi:hypothetical protein
MILIRVEEGAQSEEIFLNLEEKTDLLNME